MWSSDTFTNVVAVITTVAMVLAIMAVLYSRHMDKVGEWKLFDLSDERRSAKARVARDNGTMLPEDDRDVTNKLVIPGPVQHFKRPRKKGFAMLAAYPHCADHGAMNRVDQHERIYRCSQQYCGVGARMKRRRW